MSWQRKEENLTVNTHEREWWRDTGDSRVGHTKLKGDKNTQKQEMKLSETRAAVCFHNKTGSTNGRIGYERRRNSVGGVSVCQSGVLLRRLGSMRCVQLFHHLFSCKSSIYKVGLIPVELLLLGFSLASPWIQVRFKSH